MTLTIGQREVHGTAQARVQTGNAERRTLKTEAWKIHVVATKPAFSGEEGNAADARLPTARLGWAGERAIANR